MCGQGGGVQDQPIQSNEAQLEFPERGYHIKRPFCGGDMNIF